MRRWTRTALEPRAADLANASVELLELVGLPDPRCTPRVATRISCRVGMRQRVMIAIAIACQPQRADRGRADDGPRRHDPSAGARRCLRAAQRETGAAMVLITHDLGVVAGSARPTWLVMYAGQADRVRHGRRRRSTGPQHAIHDAGCSPQCRGPTCASRGWRRSTAARPSLVARYRSGCRSRRAAPWSSTDCGIEREPELVTHSAGGSPGRVHSGTRDREPWPGERATDVFPHPGRRCLPRYAGVPRKQARAAARGRGPAASTSR